ncbi:toll/interleukin-1 receptor domain-containing protein [Streptomyces scabiei]|uniref:toll/interleukin-1 receptor domain-containing protein n=1 Tax=Streptomyces scabiei TaxID=1930 RepID=UPI000765A9B9|nr:toll/interleukin-1 receptor domain-containing protein [Streptomyces scabiei]
MTVDFFISYADDDLSWAEWIGWQLENEGYTIRLGAWDHEVVGGNSVLARDRDLQVAKRLIAVVSPSYRISPQSNAEWSSFLRDDPTGEDLTVVPVQIEPAPRSALLGNLTPVILHGLSEKQAATALKRAVTRTRLKPSHEPGFPGRRAPQFPQRAAATGMRADTKFLLALLLFDLAFFVYGATSYSGDGGSADLKRAIFAIVAFVFTVGTVRRWFTRRF